MKKSEFYVHLERGNTLYIRVSTGFEMVKKVEFSNGNLVIHVATGYYTMKPHAHLPFEITENVDPLDIIVDADDDDADDDDADDNGEIIRVPRGMRSDLGLVLQSHHRGYEYALEQAIGDIQSVNPHATRDTVMSWLESEGLI